MELVVGHDVAVAKWVAEKLLGPDAYFVPPYHALGIVNKGGLLRGGFVIKPLNFATCDLTVYSEKAITPGVAKRLFRILFDHLGFARCVILTARDNKAVKSAAPKMGFRFECKAQDYYGPGEDALQFSMIRNSCRWLKADGQPLQVA